MTEKVVPTTKGTVAPTPAAKRKTKAGVQIESQNDLAYLTGEHSPAETEQQVRTPAPRRTPTKPKPASRGDRR